MTYDTLDYSQYCWKMYVLLCYVNWRYIIQETTIVVHSWDIKGARSPHEVNYHKNQPQLFNGIFYWLTDWCLQTNITQQCMAKATGKYIQSIAIMRKFLWPSHAATNAFSLSAKMNGMAMVTGLLNITSVQRLPNVFFIMYICTSSHLWKDQLGSVETLLNLEQLVEDDLKAIVLPCE